MKIAIVGAEESKWTKEQKKKAIKKINGIFHSWRYATEENSPKLKSSLLLHITLVSGHCPKGGVDIWAELIADELKIRKKIYPAEVHQWGDKVTMIPFSELEVAEHKMDKNLLEHKQGDYYYYRRFVQKGYRSRNIQIAENCDILYCINPKGVWSGGTWTMNYAKKLGRKVFLIEIE